MQTSRILLVVTSSDRMGRSPEPTGSWLEEVVAPYYAFVDAKYDVTIASPRGGNAPLDSTGVKPEHATASTRRYDADVKLQHTLGHTLKLDSIDPANYDAIFFAGGHGAMEDFPNDAKVKSLVEYFYQAGKPVASVCHGVACLVNAMKKSGTKLIHGHSFTCFSDEEETVIGYEKQVPFLLESKLKAQGGKPQMAKPDVANVVVDSHLITGQNPASSIPAAEAVIHGLRSRFASQHAA